MSQLSRILVIEDGHEYISNLQQFLAHAFHFTRAGDGFEALELLATHPFDGLFLDMRFDRADRLIGDLDQLTDRFAGDVDRARRFLENNQGTYILASIREAGHQHPAVFSYDFDSAPRRFRNLVRRYGPLRYLNDTAGPKEIQEALSRL